MSTLQATPPAVVRFRIASRVLAGAVIALILTVLVVAAMGTGHARPAVRSQPAGNFMGLHYPGTGASPTARLIQPSASSIICAYIRPEQRCIAVP